MNSKESLETLFDLLIEKEHTISEHGFWLRLYQEVKKDLEILDCFKKLFEGEDLYDWIEFNFCYTDEDENDNDYNYNDYVNLINKIRKWLKNENNK